MGKPPKKGAKKSPEEPQHKPDLTYEREARECLRSGHTCNDMQNVSKSCSCKWQKALFRTNGFGTRYNLRHLQRNARDKHEHKASATMQHVGELWEIFERAVGERCGICESLRSLASLASFARCNVRRYLWESCGRAVSGSCEKDEAQTVRLPR